MKNKKFFIFISIILIIIILSQNIFAFTFKNQISKSQKQLNDDYIALENKDNLYPYVTSKTSLTPVGSLPSSYQSEISSVKNQYSFGSCWSFNSTSAMENAIKRKFGGPFLDLSEAHMLLWSMPENDGYGWQLKYGDGGYPIIAAGYLSSGGGCVDENNFVYNKNYSSVPNNFYDVKGQYIATDIIYLNTDINTIKQAIINYGEVATSFSCSEKYLKNGIYYCPGPQSEIYGHAISIYGWDDSGKYWLAKNSWGEKNFPTIKISYYDYYLFNEIFGQTYAVADCESLNNKKIYQNEKYGATTSFGVNSNGSFVNVMTAINVFNFEKDTSLDKVIFQTDNTNYNYKVYYIPISNGKPVTDTSKWTLLYEGVNSYSGYKSVDIGSFKLPTGLGAIGIMQKDIQGANFGVDEEIIIDNDEYIFKSKSQPGKSYFLANSKLYELCDFYNKGDEKYGANFVIKALTSKSGNSSWKNPFKDVFKSKWYYDSVEYAVSNKIFSGVSSTEFKPEDTMTRAMFVTVLANIYGVDKTKYNLNHFNDVKSSSWYTPYVNWAYKNGIVNGTSATTFSPNKKITRQEMAVMLYNFAYFSRKTLKPYNLNSLEKFDDDSSVAKWAKNAMAWALTNGIINGVTSKTLLPKNYATRAQNAKIFKSFLKI